MGIVNHKSVLTTNDMVIKTNSLHIKKIFKIIVVVRESLTGEKSGQFCVINCIKVN